jgi:hypothetical protein
LCLRTKPQFDNRGWFFMNLEDLKETDTCFAVRWKDMELKGLFDELTR